MASTSKTTGSGLEFPGKIIYRAGNEDIHSPEQHAQIESVIQNYEKARQTFVFPTQTVRAFSILIIILGMLSLVVQISSSSMRYAFVPSLLGSGIWIGMFCVISGAVGLVSAQRLSMSMLLDFNIMTLIATTLSAILVVLNSIGLEMYTKLCYNSWLPTRENLITGDNQNGTMLAKGAPMPAENAPFNWVGDCGQSSLILMGIVVFLHVMLFLVSASCSSYICRALNSSYTVRQNPVVLLHRDTVEIEKTIGPGTSTTQLQQQPHAAGTSGVGSETKMMEKLHHPGLERGAEHHGGGVGMNTPAVP